MVATRIFGTGKCITYSIFGRMRNAIVYYTSQMENKLNLLFYIPKSTSTEFLIYAPLVVLIKK